MSPESDSYVSRNIFTRKMEDHASCIELNTYLFFKSWADRAKCLVLTSAIEKRLICQLECVSMVSKKKSLPKHLLWDTAKEYISLK